MRTAFAAVIVFGAAVLAHAQPPNEPEPRYGVKARLKQYPQGTPKQTLKSAVAAIDGADLPHLVGQLLDPKFVDAAVAERAKQFEPVVEGELARLRDFQRANRNTVTPENRVPLDPQGFRALAAEKARDRGFKQL